ncbi:short transient receptor potential channel 7 isoform X1 [Patella vulgata]|uniref:short transient receptor potential channel 7 isoform X1 n=2 Tax=Patella vulgata TaxID=6465 RepID=UPI0024A9478C|nr:short transient receptor potential channel 7 isoform X1 [Patella vulgata]
MYRAATIQLKAFKFLKKTSKDKIVKDENVDMPMSGRNKVWRRRNGSHRYSFMSNASQESLKTFADAEEEFLHAAEFGDIPGVKRLLNEFPDLNIDCIDALGRTALRLAVKNEHLEVVEHLLDRSSQHHIYEAVLQAISAGHVQIAETILKHRRYLEMWRERRKMGDTDGFFKTVNLAESQFSPDITPLILASQKNQYEIVQLLLLRGELIQKPHKFTCSCQECRNKTKFDQLRLAKYRLNAYRGLASEAYLSLSSKDPILSAFELAEELRKLSKIEKHFKKEYKELAEQLSEYVVKLLDRIRTQEELEMVLNKTGRSNQEKYESLARFKLALCYHEKGFVSHPSCQQRLVKLWYTGMGRWERNGWPQRILFVFLLILCYPFLIITYLIAPNCKFVKVLKYPFVKFVGQSLSFFLFLMLIISSAFESSQGVSKYRTYKSTFPSDHVKYEMVINATGSRPFGDDFPLRTELPSVPTILMSLWVLGFMFQECSQIYQNGLLDYITSYYNIMDFGLISAYTATFTLRFLSMYKFWSAQREIEQSTSLDPDKAFYTIYWLNADRFYWDAFDPINLSEGLFAIANILSFARISYLLPANESLGPLQISLGRMLNDIAKFITLFVFVMVAFMIGLHNLFWYYSNHENLEIENRNMTINAKQSFGDVMATFRTVFWSLFGRGEPDAVRLGEYNNNVTEDIGYIIYGAYNATSVTVLLNMLIAMMTRSFQTIAEDSDAEWKFSRSMLYMEYIGDSAVLPVPFNVILAPKEIVKTLFCSCCHNSDDDVVTAKPGKNRLVEESTGTTGAANLAYDSVAVEMTETNGSQSTERKLPMSSSINEEPELDEKITYTKVMQRIIQRYIFDIQREAEVTEDDFEEIKQDISSFRYEILNQWRTKEVVQSEMANNLVAMKKHIESLHSELSGRSGSREGQQKEPTKASVVCPIATPEDIETLVKDKKKN